MQTLIHFLLFAFVSSVTGNTVYEGRNWFRALCNPKGDTPCCYNNVCVNKSTFECHCPMCYDLRSKIHAELADWIPDDPKCKATNRLKCDKHYRYIAECRGFIRPDILVCGNTTILHCEELYTANTIEKVLLSMRGLSGKENSWFIVGFGAHDSYNVTLIQEKLIGPLLAESKKNKWPQLVWYEPHAPGLLKTPMIPHQLAPNRISFNSKVKLLMEQQKIPNLRFYKLTEEVMSYDGSHYGKGVNDVKFQILLNYLLEQKSKIEAI
ncbi:hypothetical protein Btru_051339 [Bulinus truncatus]|nr:hypothetical protein Btru_051339 [Bulinus truncatus]